MTSGILHGMDRRQLGTVLAALRHWQRGTTVLDRTCDPIASDESSFAPLNDAEIDRLCEGLNHE